jgi:hypothetical protein
MMHDCTLFQYTVGVVAHCRHEIHIWAAVGVVQSWGRARGAPVKVGFPQVVGSLLRTTRSGFAPEGPFLDGKVLLALTGSPGDR